MKYSFAVALPLLLVSAQALAGPDWVEGGDAGSVLLTAQPVVGVGAPIRISGRLSGAASGFADNSSNASVLGDYEDMYIIRIEKPGTFSFTVSSSNFDSQLFLFNITLASEAFGLLANQSTSTPGIDARITGMATDGTGAMVLNPGTYALAISGMGRNPVSSTGGIFNFATPNEISGPDGPGGLNAHLSWTGVGEVGDYDIDLFGIGYVDVPSPGMAGLLGVSSLAVLRRRRRSV